MKKGMCLFLALVLLAGVCVELVLPPRLTDWALRHILN